MVGGNERHVTWLVSWVSKLAWASVPLAYLLGYVAWGFYSLRLGTGYLPVGHERYLAAGFTLIGACAILVGAAALGWWAPGKPSKGSASDLRRGLLVALGFAGLVPATEQAFSLENVVLSEDFRGRFKLGLGLAFAIGFAIRGTSPSKRGSHVLSRLHVTGLAFALVVVLAVLVALWGQEVLPYVAQEFGGGAPECATLVLPRMLEFNETVEVEAYVFHRDQDWIVFASKTDENFFSPSILDTDQVLGFSWCPDGRYPSVNGPYPDLPGFPGSREDWS